MKMLDRLLDDFELAHRRRWPGRPASLASRAWLLIACKGLRVLLIHRCAHWLYLKRQADGRGARLWLLATIPCSLVKWVIQTGAKSQIVNESEIEGGVSFSDQGHIIFGADRAGAGTVIGTRCTIGQGLIDPGHPEIGRNVWIGADCVLVGSIRIGDGATLLPGTVLTKSIPARAVVQGNPARLVLRDFDNSRLRERQNVDAMRHVASELGAACSITFMPI